IEAFVAYENSLGGVDGRKLALTPYDAQISPTNFQAATQQSCSSAFAIVGSYSIGDNGGVAPGQQCGIPVIPAGTTAPQVLAASNVVAPLPTQPNVFSTGYFHWLAQAYPSAVTKAGILYPDNQVTRVAAQRVVATAGTQGFHYLEDQVVSLIQVDFTSFILDMKNKGVQQFTWGADYQAMGRLLQSMQQQNWHPQVFDGTAAGYTQAFLKQSGPQAQGMLMSLPISLLNETAQDPMMKTYLTWLDKTVPNHAPPDLFGVTSWSAGLLFVKAMEQAGKNPTRAQVLKALHSVHSWNGDGIQAPSNPGSAIGTNCFVAVKVESSAFVRAHHSQPGTF
ncbi:MAG: ABC transporter substrate-binding protein, partial [Acidimicrobiales bacterium]